VRSADGTHGFAIKGLGVRAKVPRDGEPVIVEFDANRKGTFEIACFEYCGTGHRGMKATLVVNPTTCREAGKD
jgi:heme/copper-type cytochrome/quinol oxidase subunit 2